MELFEAGFAAEAGAASSIASSPAAIAVDTHPDTVVPKSSGSWNRDRHLPALSAESSATSRNHGLYSLQHEDPALEEFAVADQPEDAGGMAETRCDLAMLSGLGMFVLSLPVSVLLFFGHYQQLYPKDPQNLLSALTGAVVVGLILALVTIPAVLAVLRLLDLSRGKPTTSAR